MSRTIQTKINNTALALSPRWLGKEVSITETADTLVLKEVKRPDFWQIWRSLKPLTKNVRNRDINDAIRWARQRKDQ